MNTLEKFLPKLEVIGFDFYDGVIEGITYRNESGALFYFKMIAWDSNQIVRLFVMTRIEPEVSNALIEILLKTQGMPTAPVWLPKWRFGDEVTKLLADRLVGECSKNLKLEPMMLIGEDVVNKAELLCPNIEVMSEAIATMNLAQPDELDKWMPRIRS